MKPPFACGSQVENHIVKFVSGLCVSSPCDFPMAFICPDWFEMPIKRVQTSFSFRYSGKCLAASLAFDVMKTLVQKVVCSCLTCLRELFEGYYFCQAQREDYFKRAKPYKGHSTISRLTFSFYFKFSCK